MSPTTRLHSPAALPALAAILLAPLGFAGAAESQAPGDRPDIVVIIGDDMGYSDFGCYGGEIDTPHIDRLASDGLRFTQYHSENMCAPTRATLLTGRYHIRGFSKGDNVTIPQVLSAAGYRTCMSGKWHNTDDSGGPQAPLARGFDRFFGTPIGCGSFFAPLKLSRDGLPAENEWRENKDFYYTDAISENAAAYVREAPKDQPLFLYVAYTAAHWPLHALPEDIARYTGRYAGGWDGLRRERLARMKELGVIGPDVPLSPRNPKVPAWDDEAHQAWQARRMEVYAAQVDRMDQGIGRILDALKARGRLENTLILFTIDNGGCHVEYGANRKGSFLNETTRDGRPLVVGNRPDVMPAPSTRGRVTGTGGRTPATRRSASSSSTTTRAAPGCPSSPSGPPSSARAEASPARWPTSSTCCRRPSTPPVRRIRRRSTAAPSPPPTARASCRSSAASSARGTRSFSGSSPTAGPSARATGNSSRWTSSRGNSTTWRPTPSSARTSRPSTPTGSAASTASGRRGWPAASRGDGSRHRFGAVGLRTHRGQALPDAPF